MFIGYFIRVKDPLHNTKTILGQVKILKTIKVKKRLGVLNKYINSIKNQKSKNSCYLSIPPVNAPFGYSYSY